MFLLALPGYWLLALAWMVSKLDRTRNHGVFCGMIADDISNRLAPLLSRQRGSASYSSILPCGKEISSVVALDLLHIHASWRSKKSACGAPYANRAIAFCEYVGDALMTQVRSSAKFLLAKCNP
jgi:hypothetical protein